ncbi:hypothetical protein [Corallococcus sp. EGB]|uniref:hypothetical protein n=1 Tax=Corallococcus sp. EGB TaxID=1521117 RepID=UPI001CBB8C9B|nr:hypothetical protein [Corallococcus sp. EGB]
MGVMNLALEEGGPRSLKVFWRDDWRDLQIELEGQPVGSVADPLQLEQGVEFTLPDGSVLHVQLVHVVATELRVRRNGVPLPESSTDPVQQARSATYMLYTMAALTTGAAMVSFVITNNLKKQLPVSLVTLLMGGCGAVLGFFMFKRSRAAALVAVLFFAADSLSTAYTKLMAKDGPGVSIVIWLIVRALIFAVLVRGFLGARELARRKKQGPGTVPPAVGPVAGSPATSASLHAGTGPG